MGNAELADLARRVRQDVIRMVTLAGGGHPGGALSATDLLVGLYFHALRIDPQQPQWPGRDRFVLSKGHSCAAYYAVLAQRGFFDRSELWRYRQYDSILSGHPDMKRTPGVDFTTGSLGDLVTAAEQAVGASPGKTNGNRNL